MIAPWVQRQLRRRSPRTRDHYFIHRFAGASQAVIVLLIGIEFLILTTVTFVTLATGWYALMIGFLVPYGLHLLGHITELFVYRAYTPSLLTSVVTLPLCAVTGCALYVVSGSSAAEIVLAACVMTVLFGANFALIGALEPRATRWFAQYTAAIGERGAPRRHELDETTPERTRDVVPRGGNRKGKGTS